MKRTRKPRTRSPRVVTPRKPRTPRIVKETVALPVRSVQPWIGNHPTFPKRRDPFTEAELAGLEIPAFLKR